MAKDEEIRKLFGLKLREYRKSKNLTQEQLAELVDMDTQHYCKIENGLHFPSFKNLLKLSDVLEVKIDTLLSSNNSAEDSLIRKLVYSIENKLSFSELEFINSTVEALYRLRIE